jgi:ribosome-associated heat shock protein Hsp15
MSCRLDKYVWSVRLTKTRSQASEEIAKGKIKLNQSNVKPSREVKIGDIVSISKNSATFSYEVLGIIDKRVGAKLVETYLRDITPIEEIEKFKMYRLAQSVYREKGTGKPSKKDRRDLNDFLDFEL